jgi:hypothetical protein
MKQEFKMSTPFENGRIKAKNEIQRLQNGPKEDVQKAREMQKAKDKALDEINSKQKFSFGPGDFSGWSSKAKEMGLTVGKADTKGRKWDPRYDGQGAEEFEAKDGSEHKGSFQKGGPSAGGLLFMPRGYHKKLVESAFKKIEDSFK